MATLTCPICKHQFDSERSEAMHFCSHRCRLVDLGRWLGEEYGLVVDPEAELDWDNSDEPD